MSKTQEAVRLVREQGMTVRAAARAVDLSEQTVRRELQRQSGICPCCGQKLPEKTIDT